MFKNYKQQLFINLNEFVNLLKKIAVVLVLYTVQRVLFYFFNTEHYPDMTLLHFFQLSAGGLKFDISAIMFTNFFYIFLFLLPFPFKYRTGYRKFLNLLFIISNSIAFSFNMTDVFYYDFILKRSTAEIFMFAGEGNILTLLKLFLIDYWFGFLIGIALIIAFIYIIRRLPLNKTNVKLKFSYYFFGILILAFSGVMSVFGMRGSFIIKNFPITLGDAGAYVNKPDEIAIVLNTPFSILKTLESKTLEEKDYFTEDEIKDIYSPIHKVDSTDAFQNKNVIIIVMESFSREYVGSMNTDIDAGNYPGYTPYLDSLIYKSRSFFRAFANGRKSIECLPAITAGIPSVMQSYVTSPYATNRFSSLATLLETKGYSTSFFHGSPKGALGLDAFMKFAGYQDLYSMDEYGDDDFDGTWGVWDEEFFQYFADKLNTFEEPFHSVFFSMSSHHPFKLPKKYENTFPEGKLSIHKSVQYADMAIEKFFNKISKQKWFNNTLFVITADHASVCYYDKYNTGVGKYAIPIIFYAPGDSLNCSADSSIAQQIDVMPTVLNYLNYDKSYFSFGKDLFSEDKQNFALSYLNDTYQLIIDDYVLYFRDDEVSGFFNFEEDKLLMNDLKGKVPEMQQKAENILKAFIQEYNQRMIKDKLSVSH